MDKILTLDQDPSPWQILSYKIVFYVALKNRILTAVKLFCFESCNKMLLIFSEPLFFVCTHCTQSLLSILPFIEEKLRPVSLTFKLTAVKIMINRAICEKYNNLSDIIFGQKFVWKKIKISENHLTFNIWQVSQRPFWQVVMIWLLIFYFAILIHYQVGQQCRKRRLRATDWRSRTSKTLTQAPTRARHREGLPTASTSSLQVI